MSTPVGGIRSRQGEGGEGVLHYNNETDVEYVSRKCSEEAHDVIVNNHGPVYSFGLGSDLSPERVAVWAIIVGFGLEFGRTMATVVAGHPWFATALIICGLVKLWQNAENREKEEVNIPVVVDRDRNLEAEEL